MLLCFGVAQRFRVCVRTRFRAIRWNEAQESPAPEGRTSLAQRFSAGKSGRNQSSPGGTTQFSRTRFSAAVTALLSVRLLAAEVAPSAQKLIFPQSAQDLIHQKQVGEQRAQMDGSVQIVNQLGTDGGLG